MKRILLIAALAAILSTGAQAHIGWSLSDCQARYGAEVKPSKNTNSGVDGKRVKEGQVRQEGKVKEDEIGMGHRGPRLPSSGAKRKFLLRKQAGVFLTAKILAKQTARAPEEKGKQLLNGLRPRRVNN